MSEPETSLKLAKGLEGDIDSWWEEQEMAASVHAFAMRSRLPSDMRRAPTGETNDS